MSDLITFTSANESTYVGSIITAYGAFGDIVIACPGFCPSGRVVVSNPQPLTQRTCDVCGNDFEPGDVIEDDAHVECAEKWIDNNYGREFF